jgi:hypothetical protein
MEENTNNIMAQQKLPPPIVLDKDSFSGGWITDFTQSNGAALESVRNQLGIENQYSQSQYMSTFRVGYYGHLSPGEGFTALTDSSARVTQLPLNGVTDSSGNMFAILKNGRIVKFSTTAVNSTTYDPASATTTENGDIIILKDAASTPVEYLP